MYISYRQSQIKERSENPTIENLILLENLKFGFKLSKNLLPAKIADCTVNDQHGNSLKKMHKYSTRYRDLQFA